MPFMNKTKANTQGRIVNYGKALEDWFAKIRVEKEQPNAEQWRVLEAVRDRLPQELELNNESAYQKYTPRAPQATAYY